MGINENTKTKMHRKKRMISQVSQFRDIQNVMERRAAIFEVEELLTQHPGAVREKDGVTPLIHRFTDGFYVREIFIPKGFLCTGKIHKHAHPSFLLKGEVSVFTEQEGNQRLKAPMTMISQAGTKRVVYAHEDTVWVTVHLNPTNTQDLQDIEDTLIAKDYSELPGSVINTKELA